MQIMPVGDSGLGRGMGGFCGIAMAWLDWECTAEIIFDDVVFEWVEL